MVAVQVKVKTKKRHFETPPSLGHAVENLELALGLCKWIEVYAHFFPEEFAREIPVELSDREGLARLFVSMLEIIDSKLFPVPWWYSEHISMLEDEGEGLPIYTGTIPVEHCNQPWWDTDFEDLDWLARAILLGTGEIDETGKTQKTLTFIDTKLVKKRLKRATKPVSNLLTAIRILFHSTGNPYLDITPDDDPVSVDPWCIESVDSWRKCYRECLDLHEKYIELREWIGKDKARFDQIKELVQSVMVQKKEQQWELETF